MQPKKNAIPIAKKKPKELIKHGDVRVDDYYWLNERDNEEVLQYLKEENAYFEKETAHLKSFKQKLFKEMKGRIKEDDISVPYKKNGYYYISKYETGKQYPIHFRKKESLQAKEELLFDINEMAEGYSYYKLTGVNVSPNNKIVAFAVDNVGRRQYTIKFKNLETGKMLPDSIENTTGSVAWSNDCSVVFYTKKNDKTLRAEKILKHKLGAPTAKDVEVYYEKDETFSTYIYRSKSGKYLIIGSQSTLSSEYQILEADNPNGTFSVFQKRQKKVEYTIAHYNKYFYILTNKDKATNFKLMKTSENTTTAENWIEVISHRKKVLLEDISIFKDFLVLEERYNGLNHIRVLKWDDSEDFYIPFDEETYHLEVHYNPEFDSETIRYEYNSLTTPHTVVDFNVTTKTKEIKKQQQILGGKFKTENYKSERLWATAQDGVKIPISLVYHKNTLINSNTPLLLYGYGSYGMVVDANFSSARLSLLDRGFIFAIAHVRGGEYLGRKWYKKGKLLKKKNTFTDFIDVAKHLIANKYTSSNHLYASGGSAGGLLIGSVVNLAPKLFKGVIATVPFVDVLTTMLDNTIPLTTGEYDEWGNPNKKKYYNYIKSYSPYDNIEKKEYPNILVTTGLHDSQVQYFEPAKWVAKLREYKTDNNKLLFYINLDTGHSGFSGRFDILKEIAIKYSYLIDLELNELI